MILDFKMEAFERVARRMGAVADQVPFALSQAMNDAVKGSLLELVQETWPTHVDARNKGFLKFAFGRAKFSTKRNLRVELNDDKAQGRGNLAKHAEGGTRTAKNGNLAVPATVLKGKRRTKGIPKAFRPKNLPNSFRKGDVIYQRTGKGGKNLKLMYVLRPSVTIKADVPFEQDFRRTMREGTLRAFGPRIRAAMLTRRSRNADAAEPRLI